MAETEKKRYEAPCITTLGSLEQLTAGGGGTDREPVGQGGAKTKATGTTA